MSIWCLIFAQYSKIQWLFLRVKKRALLSEIWCDILQVFLEGILVHRIWENTDLGLCMYNPAFQFALSYRFVV